MSTNNTIRNNLVFGVSLFFVVLFVTFYWVLDKNPAPVSDQYPDLSKRIPIDTRYLLVDTSSCPAGYVAVKNEGADMDFLIPKGTLVIATVNPNPDAQIKYLLCGKIGERHTLLPPVK